MGRTIPSFRLAHAMEKELWKPFHNALDKSDRKKCNEIFDIPRLYTSASSDIEEHIELNILALFSSFLRSGRAAGHYQLSLYCVISVMN
jgi:hypothetical protein